MRREFAKELVMAAAKNDKIWLVTADLGYGMWDEFKTKYPERFINTGAAEQAAADICVGLALEGKIPFFYTITPFFLRCFETLRTYIDYESVPVKLVGAGRNQDYKHDGISHWADDIGLYLSPMKNIYQFWPQTANDIPSMVKEMVSNKRPCFISLAR